MPLEIEKKYRLTASQKRSVSRRLSQIGAKLKGTEFEENVIYTGEGLEPGRSILRLRRIGNRAILTYKERFPGKSSGRRAAASSPRSGSGGRT